jgi:CcmD family protein
MKRLAIVAISLLLVVQLAAQEPPGKFEPLKPGSGQETLPAAPLVYAAYAAVWLVLLGYVFILWRRASRIEQGLAAVRDQLDKR